MSTSAALADQNHQPAVDFGALNARQQNAWSSGDYAVVGTTLQIVGESLCEALDLRAGSKVLDVAAGNGNGALAAARRWCDVTATDYVPALLERARERAKADRLSITFQEADAENLPFADQSFDTVLSIFGVMFTPDQERAAGELLRVCKRGGSIGLANWTPMASSGRCSRRSVAMSQRRQVPARRRSGDRARVSRNCSRPRPPRLRQCRGSLCSATSRPSMA